MSKEPKRNVYVGHRYVPKIMGEWNNEQSYEGLSIVTHQGTSYTSKKHVPVGIDILDEEYWVVTGNYNAQIEHYRKEVRDMGDYVDSEVDSLTNYVNSEVDRLTNYVDSEVDDVKTQLSQTVRAVNYKMFGAVLDGVTDDTEAIQNAHNYANENNLPVIQRDSTFVLNGEVEVRTDVDLTGSTVITSWVDEKNGENRENYLYVIKGEEYQDYTNLVTQSEFKKGETYIPSLSNLKEGLVLFRSGEVDMVRKILAGSTHNIYKREVNLSTGDGNLVYPLTKDYTSAVNFRVYYKPYENKLFFKGPKLVLDGCRLRSFIRVERNNVHVSDVEVIENETSFLDVKAPIYTAVEFIDSAYNKVTSFYAPRIGRKRGSSSDANGYAILLNNAVKNELDNIKHYKGWGSIDGNYFRDTIITNSEVLSANGHSNVYDFKIRDSTVFESISLHGGGLLEVDNCLLNKKGNRQTAISTRRDYASEFDGIIRVKNTKSIGFWYMVGIIEVDFHCGRETILPKVEIFNCEMVKPDDKRLHYVCRWETYNGNYPSTLPSFDIRNIKATTSSPVHITLGISNIENNMLSGEVKINIDGVKIPIQSIVSSRNSENANIYVPHVKNNNVKLDYNIQNSDVNFNFLGTSNVDINCENCSITFFLTDGDSTDYITENGDPLNIRISNCDLNKLVSTFGEENSGDRVNFIIENSRYLPFINSSGEVDNVIGSRFDGLIRYAKNNIRKSGTSISSLVTYPERLFDYTNEDYWKTV